MKKLVFTFAIFGVLKKLYNFKIFFQIKKWLKFFDLPVDNYTAAYKFWSNFEVKNITSKSQVSSTAELESESDSGFRCLSLFLTGKEKSYGKIRDAVKEKFYNDFNKMGRFFLFTDLQSWLYFCRKLLRDGVQWLGTNHSHHHGYHFEVSTQ